MPRIRILIVDDDPLRLLELRVIAEQAGFLQEDVVPVASREAGEARLVEPFDIAVIDIALRSDIDEEGVDLIRWLHTKQPRCGIIALTRHKPEAEDRALQAGATFFINSRTYSSTGDWRSRVKERVATLQKIVEKRGS